MKKYTPRNQRVTIWNLSDEGEVKHVEVVEKEEFKDKHAEQILAFFDKLKKKDPTFNKTKAIDSTFIISNDEGQQSIVTEDENVVEVVEEVLTEEEGVDEVVAELQSEDNSNAEAVSEEVKAEYKSLFGRNPRSDWSLENILSKIEDKKNNSTESE